MAEETLIVINALVDDHKAAEHVLRSFIERELPGARAFRPSSLPGQGFELAAVIPAATSLDALEAKIAAELDRHEILHAELHLDVLDDG